MANRNDDLRQRLMATFRPEADEHLNAIGNHLVALERGLPRAAAAQTVEAVFRITHTLKGAARSVGLQDVERLCQGVESALSRVRSGGLELTPDRIGWVQDVLDAVARLVAGQTPAAAPQDLLRMLDREPAAGGALPSSPPLAAAPSPSPVPPSPATVRLAVSALEALQSRVEDLLALKLAAEERAREAHELVEAVRRRADEGAADGVAAQARLLSLHLARDRRLAASSLDALREEILPLRMVSAASALESLPAMVAQMARAQGKEIDVEIAGADLVMDRRVLETVKDPILHLVRNAVDHGIEAPVAREQAGKSRRGRIAIRFAALEGHRIEAAVEDDGAGVDATALRAAVVRSRVMVADEAAALSDGAALDLVFLSGVSTSPVITDLSGHGLGMAIVRTQVERIGGQVSLASVPARTTAVRLVVPATIATFRGLLVRIERESVLLPIEAVERVFRVDPPDRCEAAGREAVRWSGSLLPARDLARVLGRHRAASAAPASCGLIVGAGDARVVLLVDEIAGEREVLVKELRPPLGRVRHASGAGLLGNGELVLILRPSDLVRAVQEPAAVTAEAYAPARSSPASLLVVDDSITTRTMEKNLLEAAGYRVRTAVDGMEAWAILKTEAFDMVVSDVDMPRLNGFDLTARMRAEPRLKALPVVLVTALESREDKERGIEVGANAYVIKSGFDQSKLLEIIRRLL